MTPVISGPISSEYMLMNLKSFFSLMAAGAVALASIAAPESTGNNIIEEVAWMVGDQPIYKSEIEEAYQQMLYEKTPVNGDPYCVIPEQLAIEKLFLHQADIDTVEVQESMVSLAVDQRVNYMITNLGSKEKVEEYFRKPMSEFRSGLADMMRNQYRIQEVQRSLTKNLKVTPSDVQRYFAGLPQDSIPYIPLQVEVEIITINPKIPQEEIDDVKSRLRQYTDRINKGESEFSTLAILYSEDPGSSVRGGEIGFMGRGHLEPEYAAVAFNLNDTKKVSKIVETEYGFHIIQLIEKRGDRINCRHILLRPKVSDDDLNRAIARLDSVRADIVDTKELDFATAARYISQDKDTRYSNGVMMNQETGTTQFQMSQLPQEVARVVAELQPGEVSKPFVMKDPKSSREIVAIVKLTNRIDAHQANLGDDYQLLKGMYEESTKQAIIDKWLEKKIADTYVRIEDGWRGCDFRHKGWIKSK